MVLAPGCLRPSRRRLGITAELCTPRDGSGPGREGQMEPTLPVEEPPPGGWEIQQLVDIRAVDPTIPYQPSSASFFLTLPAVRYLQCSACC